MMTSSATAKLISDVTVPQGHLLLPKFKYHYPIVIGCYNLCYAVSQFIITNTFKSEILEN